MELAVCWRTTATHGRINYFRIRIYRLVVTYSKVEAVTSSSETSEALVAEPDGAPNPSLWHSP
jgi:hypothetical protein